MDYGSLTPHISKDMPQHRHKDVLTTGQVAKICNVAPRTVSKWFDSGQLRGYRIPGSKDRRIPLPQLIRFMKAHDIPLDGLEGGATRLLIVDDEVDIVNALQRGLSEQTGYEIRVAMDGFEAGVLAEQFRPHVILLDINLGNISGREVCNHIRDNPELSGTKVIALSGAILGEQGNALLHQGFDGFLKKPFDLRQVIQAVEDAISIVY